MSGDDDVRVSALAINVTIPEALRWTDSRRGQVFRLDTLNIRLLPDRPEVVELVGRAADHAAARWAAHRGLD